MAADRPGLAGQQDSTPADKKVSNWNAANIITVVRILFAPAFIWMLLVSTDSPADPLRWWAVTSPAGSKWRSLSSAASGS